MRIDNIEVTINGYDDFSLDELKNYVAFVKQNVTGNVTAVTVKNSDDGFVDLNYTVNNPKFERIRRITGYLTGVMDTWNDAKKAEEHDRVKHSPRI